MKNSLSVYFILLSIGCFICSISIAQQIELGTNLQVYMSSPNRMYKEQFIPNVLNKEKYTTDITYSNVPSYAIGASLRKTIQEKWGLYLNTSYEWIQLEFTNRIRPIKEPEIFEIEQKYLLQYLTPNLMVGYFFKGHRKTSPYLKIGASSHFLLSQKYSSAPYVESPSEFNSTFVSLMCEFGTRFLMKNRQAIELAFLIDADINGFEGSRNDEYRLYSNPSTLLSAGLRVHYFPFN